MGHLLQFGNSQRSHEKDINGFLLRIQFFNKMLLSELSIINEDIEKILGLKDISIKNAVHSLAVLTEGL